MYVEYRGRSKLERLLNNLHTADPRTTRALIGMKVIVKEGDALLKIIDLGSTKDYEIFLSNLILITEILTTMGYSYNIKFEDNKYAVTLRY